MDTLSSIGKGVSALVAGIIGLAILSVVLSNGSSTVAVMQSFFSGLAQLIQVVVTPVSASSSTSGSSLLTNPLSVLEGTGSSLGGSSGGLGNILGGGSSAGGISGVLSDSGINSILGGSGGSSSSLGGLTSILGGL
jgi:hypothetical protein